MLVFQDEREIIGAPPIKKEEKEKKKEERRKRRKREEKSIKVPVQRTERENETKKEERRREKREFRIPRHATSPRCPPTHNSLSSRFISLSPYPYPNIMASAMLTRKNVVVPRTTGHARNTTHAVVVRATHNETTSTRRQVRPTPTPT